MKTSRRTVLRATLCAVALVASGLPASRVAATTPPTIPAPTPDSTPAPDPQSGEAAPGEFVESWALSPAGSLDPGQAGNRSNLSYESAPGSLIDDAVTVFNFGNVQMTFRVYATDAFNNDQGEFDLLPGAQPPTDAGSWVDIAQDLITVPPGKQVTVPITIKVPLDAAPGDHAGGIVASNESESTDASGAVVKLDRRTGTRMYVRVGGPLSPELAVTDVHTTYHHDRNPLGGSSHTTFRIENRGNVRLGGNVTVSVGGLFGIGERKVTLPDLTELLPGQDVSLSADLADVPALMADFTNVTIHPAGAAGVANVKATNGSTITFAPPITVLLVLLLLLVVFLARRVFRRRAASRTPATEHLEWEREQEPQLQSP